jgi:enterochelin esterase-like enzyme
MISERRLIGCLTALLALTLPGNTRTPQQTTPPCTAGQIVQTHVSSTVYETPIAVSLYLPACYTADRSINYPVIYLLHGGNADETQWPDLNVQIDSDALIAGGQPPFLVVMPGGEYREAVDYGAFVLHDLIPAIEATYPTQTTRSGRAIGGLSLGGYWALKIAFQHPDLFVAVGGYSPVVARGHPDDPMPFVRHGDVSSVHLLSISLDVGDQDSLKPDTLALAQAIRARGIAVTLSIGQGAHLRRYWRAHTSDYLTFFLQAMAASV